MSDPVITDLDFATTAPSELKVHPPNVEELTAILSGSGYLGLRQGMPHDELNPEAHPYRVVGLYPSPGIYSVIERRNPVAASGQNKIEYSSAALDWDLRLPGTDDEPATDEEKRQTDIIGGDLDKIPGGLASNIRQGFEYIQYGFIDFEEAWRLDRTTEEFHLRHLLRINPKTTHKWVTDTAGCWTGMLQKSERGLVYLDRRKLLHHSRRGNDRCPGGESAYRSIIYWDKAKTAEARSDRISRERWGEGSLIWHAPPGGAQNKDDVSLVKRISQKWQSGKQSFLIVPHGWKFEIVHGGTTMPDPIPRLKYYDEQVVRVLDDLLSEMGVGQSAGSYALAKEVRLSSQKQYTGVCGEICQAFNQQVIERYYAYNGWDGRMPRMTVTGFEDMARLMVISQLAGNDMIRKNPRTLDMIERAVGLESPR